MSENEKLTVPVGTLANICNLTNERIQQLTKENVIIKKERGRYELWASLKNYIKYLQMRVGGSRSATGDEVAGDDAGNYQRHRSRLYKAKAENAEIEVGLIKGKIHESKAVEKIWDDMISNARSKLLALPTKLAPKLEGVTDIKDIKEIIEEAVYESLNELSDYDPNRITTTFVQINQQNVETTTETESERMGRSE